MLVSTSGRFTIARQPVKRRETAPIQPNIITVRGFQMKRLVSVDTLQTPDCVMH